MMTDVATVSNQVTARHSAGAKSAGAATGTPLDGAFAALLGAVGQTPADGDAVAGPLVTDPALLGSDVSLLAAGNGVASETGETPLLTGDIDPATGKPRKGAVRSKDAAKGDDVLLQAQAAVICAPAHNMTGEHSAAPVKVGTDTGAVAVAVQADPAKHSSTAALAVTTQTASDVPTLATRDGKSDKPAKPTSAFENVATARDGAVAQTGSNASRQSGDQSTDGDSKGARNRTEDRLVAVTDDSAVAGAVDPLRDIVQSLPPVVQSQLGPVGAAGTGRVASTGDALSDQVIDMGVSGQWVDRMAREIATVADGSGHARFQLSPPSLGRIQVDLWRGDDQMNLRLLAETDEAARRLREGQAALEAHARVASLSFGSVSVEKSSAPLDSGDKQNQRQGAEQNGTANQQSFAQAQGQSAQGRNNNSSGNLNRSGGAAVIGSERQAEPEQDARTTRAGDPRVRFA